MAADQAQYAIDIAAKMTAGDVTIDQLDQLTAKLTASGDGAVDFTAAMKRVSDQLTSATAVSKTASEALSIGESRYAELEKAADGAAKAAERAALKVGGFSPEKLVATSTALESAKAQLDALKASGDSSSEALKSQSATVKQLASELKGLSAANDLADKANTARSALEGEAKALDKLQAEANAAGDELKNLTGIQKNLTKVQDTVTSRFERQAKAVGEVSGAIGDIPGGQLAESILRPIKGFKELSAAMGTSKAMALVAAGGFVLAGAAVATLSVAMVAGVASITKWAIGLADANRAADEFSLAAQSKKFSGNIKKLFGGLNIEPFLKALSRMVDLFDAGTGSGQTMKFLLESIFQPIVDVLPKIMLWVEAFFIGLQIGALKAYMAFKPLIKTVSEFLGFNDPTTGETFKKIAKAGEYLAYVIVGVVASFAVIAAVVLPVVAIIGVVLVGAIALVVGAIAGLVAGLVYLGVKFWELVGVVKDATVNAFHAVVDGLGQALDWLRNLSLVQIGIDLMAGLARGITDGVANVVSAISGGVMKAINAAKDLLGIASPSKVFAQIGGYTADGFTAGVEGGSKDAQAAMVDMSDPSNAMRSVDASAQPDAPAGSSGVSGGITIEAGAFVFNGVKDGEAAVPALRQMLMQFLNSQLEQTGETFA